MAFTRFTKNVLNVSALPDKVQNKAQALKATFDQAGVDIKDALNQLIAELEASTSASNIGADVSSVATKTVQAILTVFEAEIANRYTKAETDVLINGGINDLVKDVDINLTTGVITVTKKDGTVETFDTALEKVPAKFEIVESGTSVFLKITNVDGTSTQTDITELMNVYEFSNSDDVSFTVTGTGNEKKVSASIRNNSIGIEKLSLSVISQFEGYVTSASNSANEAKGYATEAKTAKEQASNLASTATTQANSARLSADSASNSAGTATTKANEAAASANLSSSKATEAESYAHGGTGAREGEDTDNAKYYSEIAKEIAGGDVVTQTEMKAYAQQKGTTPTYETKTLSGDVIETDVPLGMESVLKVSGNSEQDTSDVMPSPDYPSEIRSVKSKSDNLFDKYGDFSYGNTNLRTSLQADGTILSTSNYTWMRSAGQLIENIQPNTDYVLSVILISADGTDSNGNAVVDIMSTSNTKIASKRVSSTVTKPYPIEFKFNSGDNTSIWVSLNGSNSSTSATATNTVFDKIQIIKGDKALPYQPYGYVPVEAKVEGKNLFDGVIEIGAFDDNGLNSGVTTRLRSTNYSKVSPNTTYTISWGTNKNAKALAIEYSKNDYITAQIQRTPSYFVNSPYTFTTSGTTNYVRLYIISTEDGTTSLSDIYNIQLEKGSTATNYEPYKLKTISLPLGDIELRSTPDGTRDTFVRVDGVWNKEEKVGSVVFDGSESEWNIGNEYRGIFQFNYNKGISVYYDDSEHITTISNFFKGVAFQGSWAVDNTITTITNGKIRIMTSKFTDLETFKTWLSNNPVTVQYQLATPTYTPITDQALIQALDELESLILHKGYNRITVTSVNGVKAYLDLEIPSTASVTEVVETESSLDMPVLVAIGDGDVKPKIPKENQMTLNPSTGITKIKGEKVATIQSFSVTIPTSGWIGTGPYYIDIELPGLKATDKPHYGLLYSTVGVTASDKTVRENEQLAFSDITAMIANDNSLRIICDNRVPLTQIALQLEVIR